MSEKKKIQVYQNDYIKVSYDPNICEHAAECVNGSPGVFDVKQKPWINTEGAELSEIRTTIHKCPTGALTYELPDGTTWDIKSPAHSPAEVVMVANGPLRIAGKIAVKDAEGNVIMEADRVSLCRCGASKNKPFCDGSHKTIGFEG